MLTLRYITLPFMVVAVAIFTPGMAVQSAPDNMLAPVVPGEGHPWQSHPLLTVGDRIGDYVFPGIPDGMVAVTTDQGKTVDLYINHELREKFGYPYTLGNSTRLTGARISLVRVDTASRLPVSAGLAYDTIIDRKGQVVKAAEQINERGDGTAGLSRLCSARMVEAGLLGFQDTIYLTGEETDRADSHGRGGTVWALDVANRTLWAAPDLGRGAWENLTPVKTGDSSEVALLLGDDEPDAPLYLYRGRKMMQGNFLQRNGLAGGSLYCWRADNGATSPGAFHGTGARKTGTFVPVPVKDVNGKGRRGHDTLGYLDSGRIRDAAKKSGCFRFSRPEDLHNNPANPGQVVFASTGRIGLFASDVWGSVYTIDMDTANLAATIQILYDGDDPDHRDEGIRNPDNLTWSEDGYIYVQEDNAIGMGLFGANGKEASVWRINPDDGEAKRIAMIDRTAVLPRGSHDDDAGKTGAWESSGIIDVSRFFSRSDKQTTLLLNVQAHGIVDGIIGGNKNLVQSGQVILLSN